MPIVVPTPRRRLREFLESQLKALEKNGSPQVPLLRLAVEGLVALGYGEAQQMFMPGDKNRSHGMRPYSIRKLQMQALGFADLLITNKYKPADRTVAEAYGVEAGTFRKWKRNKRLGKTTDPLMKSFREKTATIVWDEPQVRERLKRAGRDFQAEKKLAFKKKK
jgi:hypothetical protein